MNNDIYSRQPQQQGAIGQLWSMLCNTLTRSISVVNRGATTLDNLAAGGELDSATYLERSRLHNEADMALLKRQIAAESEQ